MEPSSSSIYTYTNRTTPAVFPRGPGAIVLDAPSDSVQDHRLDIVYRAYKRKNPVSPGPKVNMIYHHGNGMNKGIWHSHIDFLFNQIPQLDFVMAPDCVNHGQLGYKNEAKLGPNHMWTDFARDVVEAVRAESTEWMAPGALNIGVGHSMGGAVVMAAASLDPFLFDAVVSLNPVAYIDKERDTLSRMAFQLWTQNGKITHTYPIAAGQNYEDVIYNFYRLRSFFKRFDEKVLRNMIQDELVEDQKPVDGKVRTATRFEQEFFCYFNGGPSLKKMYPNFPHIEAPVYHVVGEHDIAGDKAVEKVQSMLKYGRFINIPEASHLVQGELPEIFDKIMINVIQEQLEEFRENGEQRYIEKKYLKQYGKDYRKIVTDQFLADGLSKSRL